MREVIKFYGLFNILSLDVVAGAVISSLFFAEMYSVVPSVISLITLALSVWIIYTADRLLDVRDIKGEAASERHRFHQRHYKGLLYSVLVAVIVNVVLVFFMSPVIIRYGILLSGVVMIYIMFGKFLRILKELVVAVLYTAGVILPAIPENPPGIEMYLPILLFFLIALINLIIFSWFERENDLKDKHNSIATLIDDYRIRKILIGLFITAFLFSACIYFLQVPYLVSFVFVIMILILLVIFCYKNFFAGKNYYRVAGDAVFMMPLLYVMS